MADRWIRHVKKYVKNNNCSYKDALTLASKTYKKKKPKKRGGNANLANAVYDTNRGNTDGYTYKGGDKRSAVYEKGGKVNIALRGTDVRSVRDLANDALIIAGLNRYSNRYKKDKALVQNAINEYGKDNVTVSGHSLAGNIARNISRDTGVSAKTYNAGASVREFVEGSVDRTACKLNPNGKRCKRARLVTNYRTVADPISILGSTAPNTKLVKQNGLNPHSVSNFKGKGRKSGRKKIKKK